MLAKYHEGVSEVANDLYGDLTNFWRVLQHEDQFPEFMRVCQATPFSEAEYTRAVEGMGVYTGSVARAWAFFVACRQSLAGRMESFAPLSRTRTRRGMNEQASAWLNAVEGLPAVHERLKRVAVLNRNALDVIRQQDGEKTLFYLDPPYIHSSRTTTGEYAHEMDEVQHRELLTMINGVKGAFMLSGYHSEMYDEWAGQSNFRCHEFDLPNNSAGGESKRRMVECVWTNF